MTFLAFHSFRGGTGKTLLGVNTAMLLAKQGKNVCLLDLDFSAPSLYSVLEYNGTTNTYWINNFVEDKCIAEEFLIDLSKKYKTKGKLLVGFANPDVFEIREVLSKGRKWQMNALSQLMSLKKYLQDETNVDHVIVDTSPGLQYSSVNAIVASDAVLIVIRLDKTDFDGTINMIKGLHQVLKKKTYILVNRVVPGMNDQKGTNHIETLLQNMFSKAFKDDKNIKLLGWVSCYCSIAIGMSKTIFAITEPSHPFIETIDSFLPILFK